MIHRHKWKHFCIAVALGLLQLVSLSASAQQGKTGEIRGQVVDSAGAELAKAAVFVHRSASSEDVTRLVGHTNPQGGFVLILPEGAYDVLVTSQDFVAGVATVAVRAGKTSRLRFKLKVVPCDFPGMNCDVVM